MTTTIQREPRPTIYITDDFETWKNKINGMVDWVEDNMDLLLEDCVEDLVSKTMDDRAIIMSLVFGDSQSSSISVDNSNGVNPDDLNNIISELKTEIIKLNNELNQLKKNKA